MNRKELLEKYKMFYFFEELSKIPRGSGEEQAVSDHVYAYAKEKGLEAYQDDANNIIIKKEAHPSMKNRPAIILQGHLDMVNVKEENCKHDFSKDPIELIYEGDNISANGTTLGADNGIAVAMTLAMLSDKDIVHPKITAIFTTEEETGMGGAHNLDATHVEGEILINLDSEDEGILLGSCAGGVRNIVTQNISRRESNHKEYYKMRINGLLGGHSGAEIHKGRANGIKLLGRILQTLREETDYDLIELNGGAKMNSIPENAEAIISIDDIKTLEECVAKMGTMFKNEFGIVEKNMQIKLEKITTKEKVLETSDRDKVISLLRLIPYGPQTMSQAIPGLVESSTNLGVLTTEGDSVLFESAIRSSVQTLKMEIAKRVEEAAALTGAKFELISDYPAWEYKENSHIREVFKTSYKNLFNKEAKIDALHAGLECGILTKKLGDIDMISVGPNMYDIHSPNERLEIQSTIRTWELLKDVVSHI